MSRAELEHKLMELPKDERRQFVEWVYEHELELLEESAAVGDEDDLSPEQEAELRRRLKEIDEHPECLVPWEGTVERLRQRLYAVQNQENRAS
ncbi:MAG TPA: addiction module protein [Chthoniobacteraceae bacterium]|jgi:putative addiction module component (TIGR02574 family)|nr:addiction module protein [Chthoniobacteraceae bacterium]